MWSEEHEVWIQESFLGSMSDWQLKRLEQMIRKPDQAKRLAELAWEAREARGL